MRIVLSNFWYFSCKFFNIIFLDHYYYQFLKKTFVLWIPTDHDLDLTNKPKLEKLKT